MDRLSYHRMAGNPASSLHNSLSDLLLSAPDALKRERSAPVPNLQLLPGQTLLAKPTAVPSMPAPVMSRSATPAPSTPDRGMRHLPFPSLATTSMRSMERQHVSPTSMRSTLSRSPVDLRSSYSLQRAVGAGTHTGAAPSDPSIYALQPSKHRMPTFQPRPTAWSEAPLLLRHALPQTANGRKRSHTLSQLENRSYSDYQALGVQHVSTLPRLPALAKSRVRTSEEPYVPVDPRLDPLGLRLPSHGISSYDYSLPMSTRSSSLRSSLSPEVSSSLSKHSMELDSLSVSDEDEVMPSEPAPVLRDPFSKAESYGPNSVQATEPESTSPKRPRLDSPFELSPSKRKIASLKLIYRKPPPQLAADPLLALPPMTPKQSHFPSITPSTYARKLKIFLSTAREAFEGVQVGEQHIKPRPGSIITSRLETVTQRTGNQKSPALEFVQSYDAAPAAPLKQLRVSSREIWGKDYASCKSIFPIVHRFSLPEVRFDKKGKSLLAITNADAEENQIACIKYDGELWLTGLYICRILRFRFEAFGRRILNLSKFHEGIYSDLRNLRDGDGSVCELPRSPFLQILHIYNAVNTRKQQKVFRWDDTPHDRLFLAQLDRDLERQAAGAETVSVAVCEPALSFTWDVSKSLLEQLGYEKTRAAVTNVREKSFVSSKQRAMPRRMKAGKSITTQGLDSLVLGVYNTPAFALSAIGADIQKAGPSQSHK